MSRLEHKSLEACVRGLTSQLRFGVRRVDYGDGGGWRMAGYGGRLGALEGVERPVDAGHRNNK